ncbi:MAG TPA: hypothetical protein PK867_11940 [Pirellulales bacterium]|nr:hypothetical protein [Pirellulales bacterium]
MNSLLQSSWEKTSWIKLCAGRKYQEIVDAVDELVLNQRCRRALGLNVDSAAGFDQTTCALGHFANRNVDAIIKVTISA